MTKSTFNKDFFTNRLSMFPFRFNANYTILIVAFIFFISCVSDHSKKTVTDSPSIEAKNLDKDPLSKSTVESQYFDVDAEIGGIVESKNGMVISVPENAFIDNEGNVIKGSVRIELAEAFGIEDMILSGLETLTDKNKPLETDGMFYFKATANGKNVNVSPKNPIYIESPVSNEKDGFNMYNGVRNKDGKIRWQDPKPMERWLVPVDLELLNFYPEGFESAVAEGMPFRNYQTATKELTDSLYYSLDNSHQGDHQACSDCGIKPASIKVLKSKQFNNTLISTREFATRLKVIINACDQKILNIYINNLNKNLWECDSLAAIALQGRPEFEAHFKQFAREQLTKIKTDRNVKKLADFYNQRLKETEKELDKIRKRYAEQLKTEEKKAEKMEQNYSKLLIKRLHYRMNKFGFILTEQGWMNVDKEGPSTKKFMDLKATIKDGKTFDRSYVYIVNPMIKSIFALTSSDSVHFEQPYLEDNILVLYEGQSAVAIGVAYKDDKPFYGLQYFVAQEKVNIELNLKATTDSTLRENLAQFNKLYRKENSIFVDLAYQKSFYKEKQRQERLYRERLFIEQLDAKAFPCECGNKEEYANGARLFKANCTPCHALTQIVVGPALRGISKRRDMRWIVDFTRNSQKMIASGDPYAMELYNRYGKTEMKSFMELSENDVKDMVNYIDCIPTSAVSK